MSPFPDGFFTLALWGFLGGGVATAIVGLTIIFLVPCGNQRESKSQRDKQPVREEPSFGEQAQSRHDFLVSDRLLLSPDRMTAYSGHWVAAYQGEVKATDDTLDGLLGRLQRLGLPLQATAIRYIEENGMAAP